MELLAVIIDPEADDLSEFVETIRHPLGRVLRATCHLPPAYSFFVTESAIRSHVFTVYLAEEGELDDSSGSVGPE